MVKICVSDCAHCLLSCHWTPLKRAWFHPLCTSRYLYPRIQCTWSFSRLNSICSFSLLLWERCSSLSFLLLALFWTLSSSSVSLSHWWAQHWTSLHVWPQCWIKNHLPLPAATLLLMQKPFSFFTERRLCWLMLNLLPPESPGSFFPKLLFTGPAPSIYWACSFPGSGLWLCFLLLGPRFNSGSASPVLSCPLSLTQKTLNVKWVLAIVETQRLGYYCHVYLYCWLSYKNKIKC